MSVRELAHESPSVVIIRTMSAPPLRRWPAYPITSVDNALRLIHMLRDLGELSGRDAAQELGISRSSAHRLLSMLVFRGFAVHGEARTYLPGPSIGVPPVSFDATRELKAIATAHLVNLSEAVHETCNLSILAGTSVRFLFTIESESPLQVGDRQGFVLSAAKSAAGRAMLATLPPDRVNELFQVAPEDERLQPSQVERLALRLRGIRQLGYSLSVEEVEKGVASIAVPIRHPARDPIASISVAVPAMRAEKLTAPATLRELQRARGAIERELGYSRP